MKTKGIRIAVLAMAMALVLTGCKEKVDNEMSLPAVDMTELQKASAQKAKDGQNEIELYREHEMRFFPEAVDSQDDTSIDIWLMEGKDGLIELPEYANSEHPFLAQAADEYNAARIWWGIWSNLEVYVSDFDMQEEAIEATKNVNVDGFRDKTIEQLVKKYKLDILKQFSKGEDSWTEDDNPRKVFDAFMESSQAVFYTPWGEQTDSMEVVLDKTSKRLEALSDSTYQRYLNAEKEGRGISEALNILQNSESFAHQCSFWLRWVNTYVDDDNEEFWILASGIKLLKSELYNSELPKIWTIWRALYQRMFGGMSSTSEIPNGYYNEIRMICYRTCLKWIENHPDDMVAMNCAFLLSGKPNLNRFGANPFGNESLIELLQNCPGHLSDEK